MSERRSRAVTALRALAVVVVCAAGVVAAVALLRAPAGVVAANTGAPAAVAPRGALESMFQDDRELIYSPGPTVVRTLDMLRSLGVDRLRLTILWAAIGPQAQSSTTSAGFDAADPAAYPAGAWAPYDRVLKLARARARGIGVDFDLTAPGRAGRWAPERRWSPRPTTMSPRRPPSVSSCARSPVGTAARTDRRAPARPCPASVTGRSGTSPTSPDGWRRRPPRSTAPGRSWPPGWTAA